MKLLNQSEHQGCIHYEKPAQSTVEIRKLAQEHQEELIFHRNEIVFMTEGKVSFSFRGGAEKSLCEGQFIFIPVGGVFRYVVLKNCVVVIIRLNKQMELCGGWRLEQLYRHKDREWENSRSEISSLEINRPLWHFLDGLQETVPGGLSCRFYFDMKASELFVLLRAYYPAEQLREFFSLILSPDTLFSEYVRANHHRYYSVGELAASMNIAARHFERMFIRVFGTTPGKWLNMQKAQRVYHELHSGVKPLKQITHECGFSNQQQLNRFCKRELGENPGEIRWGKKGSK